MLRRLRIQHHTDMKVYRSAHSEWRNVLLHKAMIPVECWSAILFLYVAVDVLGRVLEGLDYPSLLLMSLPRVVTGLLGLLSLALATKRWVGATTFLFHIFVVISCEMLMSACKDSGMLVLSMLGAVSWTLAWLLQVVVGHLWLEKNSPNVANMNEVSYLAMCQSVLIAWSV